MGSLANGKEIRVAVGPTARELSTFIDACQNQVRALFLFDEFDPLIAWDANEEIHTIFASDYLGIENRSAYAELWVVRRDTHMDVGEVVIINEQFDFAIYAYRGWTLLNHHRERLSRYGHVMKRQ